MGTIHCCGVGLRWLIWGDTVPGWQCLKFKTDQQQDAKKLEKLTGSLLHLMTART